MLLELNIDLWPAFIPFERQATKATGEKEDPSASVVRIYEEDGADANFSSVQIAGSPFTCNKINAKAGNYGVFVAKSKFTVGKIYRVLFEWTVDGKTTADEINYLMKNSSSFKANVSSLALEATLTAIKGSGWTDETLKAIKEIVDAFTTENFNMSAEKA